MNRYQLVVCFHRIFHIAMKCIARNATIPYHLQMASNYHPTGLKQSMI